ncbi:MAG: rhomboid family intramembrane serine protease [Halofilum sp. (in: g-proteobacteria)]|nr:rhomboid family intramembrane serine protease [Halofilum sp. (in: g-proteobacteria)]
MLLIPFDRPIDWRRPPLVTFTLVLVNVLVFLSFQLDDGHEMFEVEQYYYESGLAAIELPHYREHLRHEGNEAFLERFGDGIDEPGTPWFGRLMTDTEFNRRLESGDVIAPDDPVHAEWHRKRTRLEARLDDTTVWGHGLRPAELDPMSFLTYMFLHGNVIHLAGNMLFLVALGLLVEVALGSAVLVGLYLLAGLGAAGLFIGLEPGGMTPLVGASGAIAGLMGLVGVLYGTRRVRFFYFIGVYFDYVKAPALVLLALWFGKELFEYIRLSDLTNVAYAAHMGGIITGALAGAALRFGTNAVDEAALDEARENEDYQQRLAAARERLAAMEPDRARPLFESLAREYPDRLEVLEGLFDACRFTPAGEPYHRIARAILDRPDDDAESSRLFLAVFRDYLARAKPKPRLRNRHVARAIDLMLREGLLDEAEPLIRAGLKRAARFPRIDEYLLRLANRRQQAGERQRARALYRQLLQAFPDTASGRQAERALTLISS